MERIYYDKLIRDRIPEIIERDGKQYETEILQDQEYQEALLKKLIEEAKEANKAAFDEEESVEKEIADIYEIIDAIIDIYDLNKEYILDLQEQRRMERGGFQKRLKLIWAE